MAKGKSYHKRKAKAEPENAKSTAGNERKRLKQNEASRKSYYKKKAEKQKQVQEL